MAERTYRWLLISLAVVGFTADQASKYGVFKWLYNGGNFADLSGNSYDLVPGWFKLIAQFDPQATPCGCWYEPLQTWSASVLPRVNHGALFGMGQEKKGTANGFFAAVSVFAAIAILSWGLRHSTARDKWLMVALGLILGGTLGNLYDRLVFNGVRDFMYFYYIEWPVFNFADCLLVVGAGVLLVQAIFAPHPSDKTVSETDETGIPEGAKA
jgi:lipoprotein signal peptidase